MTEDTAFSLSRGRAKPALPERGARGKPVQGIDVTAEADGAVGSTGRFSLAILREIHLRSQKKRRQNRRLHPTLRNSMQRQKWFELHDQEWFPGFLRDLVTQALEGMWKANRTYRPIVPLLRDALQRSRAERVVDLCSGGGGPWPTLYGEVANGNTLEVCFTDLYPNTDMETGEGFRVHAQPVDARRVPTDLRGFRTIFSSFHHFDPESARAMLADAFAHREGIAVFEAARRTPGTLLAVNGVPVLALRNAAAEMPLPLRRLVFTYLLPVIPAVLWIDGVLSCLRSYSVDDLRELTEGLSAPDYKWRVGEEKGNPVPITYLIGTPLP